MIPEFPPAFLRIIMENFLSLEIVWSFWLLQGKFFGKGPIGQSFVPIDLACNVKLEAFTES